MPALPLTALEREEIRLGIVREESDTEIGDRLGRHRCTINAEISRSGGRGGYSAVAGQRRADGARARSKIARLVDDPALAAHVTGRLEAKDSPMTISIGLARGVHGIVASISHECIYQAVYAHGRRGLRRGLHVGLHRRRRCRKHRRDVEPATAGPLGEFNLIGAGPEVAAGRTEVGHLEGDLIVGAFDRTAIVTVFDRASRHLWLADFPDDHAVDATLAALVEIIEPVPEPLRQGHEMARHATLAEWCGIDVYLADPHSPWQRPTNENGNGLVRRYVGKSTNLAAYTPADLRAVEHRINTMPRRSLHWSTAHDIYTAAVAMTG